MVMMVMALVSSDISERTLVLTSRIDDHSAAPITDGTGDLTSRIDDLPAVPITDDTGDNGTGKQRYS